MITEPIQISRKARDLNDWLERIAKAPVHHTPLCPSYSNHRARCRCAVGQMHEMLTAVVRVHHPIAVKRIDSMDCHEHHMKPVCGPEAETCPDCVISPTDGCSNFGCCSYPCETILAVAPVFGIMTDG